MASRKRTVTEPHTNGLDEPQSPFTRQTNGGTASPLAETATATTGAGETENNKIQRLLSIMEELGKLVEKDETSVSDQDTTSTEPARATSLASGPGEKENTREIVATIASLLVEAADLEAIKERLSPDNHQAVELLAQLGETLKGEKQLKKDRRSKTGEPSQPQPKPQTNQVSSNRTGPTGTPAELDYGTEAIEGSETTSTIPFRAGAGSRPPLGSGAAATAYPDSELSGTAPVEKEGKTKARRKRPSSNSTGNGTGHQLILDMVDAAHPQDQDTISIEKIKLETAKARSEIQTEDEWLNILSSAFYHATREALSLNTFVKSEGSPWPTAPLNRGGASGLAQLLPPVVQDEPLMPVEDVDRWVEIMWKQREELSDLDADALDMLCHIWLEQAIKPEDSAVAEIDRFLEMRGLQKKKSGNNRRGGFTQEQRREVLRALSHIQSIWLKLGQIEVFEDRDDGDNSRTRKKRQSVTKAFESRAFVVTDRMGQLKMDGYMDVERFIYQPGKLFAQFLFGPGRQTAILSAKAIQYDRYRQKWEKRLARYFSWQWRIQAAKGDYTRPYRVSTLLKAVGENVDERHPNATRDRLEKALDRLQADNVLASWQYDRWEEKVTEQRGWVEHWLQATLLLEPPESIRQTYNSLERNNLDMLSNASRLQAPAIEVDETQQLVRDLRNKRLEIGMSQSICAEQLGIAQGVLSRLEKSKLKPSVQLQQRIRKWLKTLG